MSRGLGEKLGISMVEDMCSVPPATIVFALPTIIRSEAIAMVCNPEEQNRLTVCAGTESGIPASNEDNLATLYPKVPSGARPTAVRAPETITASFIVAPFDRSAFQHACFAGLSAFQLSRVPG